MISKIDFELLETIAGLHEIPAGAYNIRKNSEGAGRQSTENITITTKEDKPGIDIHIKPGTKNESVHIPVIITEAGITETVYNDFYIGEGADVLIVAGCGIHNAGNEKSEHDGVHRFFVGKNAHVKYVEKHYGEGDGGGERVLNPTTILELEENAVCELEMVQIKGVDSTVRETTANLARGAKIIVTERLMTHGHQMARLPRAGLETSPALAMSSATPSSWTRRTSVPSRRSTRNTPRRRSSTKRRSAVSTTTSL